MSSMQRKTAKKGAWRSKCAAPRLGYKQNERLTCYCSYLGHQKKVTFVRSISARRPKSGPFVFTRLFRIRGPKPTGEGGRERRRGVLNEKARVAASCEKIK